MSFSKSLSGINLPEKSKRYITNVLNPLLQELVHVLIRDQPDNAAQYLFDHLRFHPHVHAENSKKDLNMAEGNLHVEAGDAGLSGANSTEDIDLSADDDDAFIDYVPATRSRAAVSAEVYGEWNKREEFKPPTFLKTDSEKFRLRDLLSKSLLFSHTDASDMEVIVDAFEKITVQSGMVVIEQGDVGDFLCILEEGRLVCERGKGEDAQAIRFCVEGDVVGELALLYNAPRAATVRAVCDSKLWRLDSKTFTSIVRDGATRKRDRYEEFLKQVALLDTLGPYERSQVADALVPRDYGPDEDIVIEGERGDTFYILEEGQVCFFKQDELINSYDHPGEYFGELALINDEPRAATVRSGAGGCRVLSLERHAFIRLLGNLEELTSKHY